MDLNEPRNCKLMNAHNCSRNLLASQELSVMCGGGVDPKNTSVGH